MDGLYDYVEIHRAIDQELTDAGYQWGNIPEIKEALASKADILVVGRAITCAKDVNGSALAFLREMDVLQVREDGGLLVGILVSRSTLDEP
jgi:3-keto-L-gulonate-6-phosphate decarboxylase